MTRTAKQKKGDYAIAMDEFHPNPSTAAAFADLKASEATEKHLLSDLRRNEQKAPRDSAEKKALRAEWLRLKEALRQTQADRQTTLQLIEEAKVK